MIEWNIIHLRNICIRLNTKQLIVGEKSSFEKAENDREAQEKKIE